MYKPKLEKDIRCPLEYGLEIFGATLYAYFNKHGLWKTTIK